MRRWLLLAALLAGPASATQAVASSAGLVTMMGGLRPLSTVLEGLGASTGRSVLVLPGVPDVQVGYQFERVPWSAAWGAVVSAHGLRWCITDALVLVGGADAVTAACATLPAAVLPAPAAPSEPAASGVNLSSVRYRAAELPPVVTSAPAPLPAPVARHAVRVRILELADNASTSAGVDWSKGLLGTLLGAAAGYAAGVVPTFAPADLTRTVSALEARGLARKLDDVRLILTDGTPTAFRSGGNLQLNLLGAGDQKIERQVQYGLGLNLASQTEPDGSVSVVAAADLSSPVSVSNPQLLDLATRSINGAVTLRPGAGAVLAAFTSMRDEGDGSGLPGLNRVPVVGLLAGRSSSTATRTTVVVTLELVE